MTITEKNLSIINNKLSRLDCEFLRGIKKRMDFRNPYFLVCFAEVVNCALDGEYDFSENLGTSELLSVISKKALHLYKNSNISEAFAEFISTV